MPRRQKLKVYRTPIGFHDAYVAAPSQKAALAAWGSDANLFARGVAEVVTDPELTKEPLAKPGTVVKRLRGTPAEQIAALPKKKSAAPRGETATKPAKRANKRPAKPTPRPDRGDLDAAEQAIAKAEAAHRAAERALRDEEARLAKARRDLDRRHTADIERLQRARDHAEAAYQKAMKTWRG
jgi:hypothetical protein